MKVLIYSDVHGNLPAFRKMLEHEGSCDSHICLGDLVNYGPWSNECVDLALSLPNSTILMGNHEEAFIAGHYPGENELVQKFFKKTYSEFKKKNQISTFIYQSKLDQFICVHTIGDKYIYPGTNILLGNNYLIGHSHHQFKYTNNNFTLYNTGSVGQNRKFINEINYLTYDDQTQTISMKSIKYDIEELVEQMRKEKYPSDCIEYYMKKERKK